MNVFIAEKDDFEGFKDYCGTIVRFIQHQPFVDVGYGCGGIDSMIRVAAEPVKLSVRYMSLKRCGEASRCNMFTRKGWPPIFLHGAERPGAG